MNALTLVDLGHCRLALPSHCIATIESINDAHPDHSANSSYWRFQRDQSSWSLYTLDDNLQPQALVPPQHRLALCLKQSSVAISCIRVETLQQPPLTPVPGMMKKPESLVQNLILHSNSVVVLADPAAIIQRLEAWASVAPLQAASGERS